MKQLYKNSETKCIKIYPAPAPAPAPTLLLTRAAAVLLLLLVGDSKVRRARPGACVARRASRATRASRSAWGGGGPKLKKNVLTFIFLKNIIWEIINKK